MTYGGAPYGGAPYGGGVPLDEGEPADAAIRIGAQTPDAVALGATPVDRMYMGSIQVWPSGEPA